MEKQTFLVMHQDELEIHYLRSQLSDHLEGNLSFTICKGDLVQFHTFITTQQFHYLIVSSDTDKQYDTLANRISDVQHACRIIMICATMEEFYRRQLHDCYFAIRKTSFMEDVKLLIYKLSLQWQKDLVYTFHQIHIHTVLHVRHIYYIESMKNYILIHKDRESLRDRTTMKEICENPIFKDFVMISRGILVNSTHIERIDKHVVFLTNGIQLYISRSQYTQLQSSHAHSV